MPRLCHIRESAEFTISDNGNGFDLAEFRASGKGLGLVSITERVRLAGGTISIVSELKKGTRLCAQIPVNASTRRDSEQREPLAEA